MYSISNLFFTFLYSYADSHGAASLRGIDPEGSRLLDTPRPELSAETNKRKQIQKPSFVVNREDSTITDGVIPPLPHKKSSTYSQRKTGRVSLYG